MTITLTREDAHQLLVALQELNRLSIGENAICLPAEIDDAMEVLEARLSQCERCGEVNAAEIHTCTPQETVLLSYWQEEARRYAKNAEYWRSKAQREWQGLTYEEIKEILDCGRSNLINIKKAEQKLKEKNYDKS